MGFSYSVDLRRRVVDAIEGGMSTRSAAMRFSVSYSAAGAWARLKRLTGDILPKKQGHGTGSVLDPYEGFILGLIEENKDTTLHEMSDALVDAHGLRIHPTTFWYWLDRNKITYKKRQRMV